MVSIPLRDPDRYYALGFRLGPLARAIRLARPDIIHVLDEPFSGYLFQAIWLRLLLAPRAKVLFYGFRNDDIVHRRFARVKWHLAWRGLSGGAAANSEIISNLRVEGFPPELPIERIFWGIPVELFKPARDASLRSQLAPGAQKVVGFIGRRTPEKGIEILMKALTMLPDGVHCLMVGSGPGKQELLRDHKELDRRIHVLPPADPAELSRYMATLDAIAVPSLTTPTWKEQYGRVIPESMAAGVPVVGSDSGAIPEVAGDAALIVPEGDPRALAKALETLIFDPETRVRLIEKGISRVNEQMSIRAMTARLRDLYRQVLPSWESA